MCVKCAVKKCWMVSGSRGVGSDRGGGERVWLHIDTQRDTMEDKQQHIHRSFLACL